MKGAQVTVKTRAKKQREQAAVAPTPEKVDDKLEDPLESLGLEDASASALASSEEGPPDGLSQDLAQEDGKRSTVVDPLRPMELHDPLEHTAREDQALLSWLSQGPEARLEGAALPEAPASPQGLDALDQALDGLDIASEGPVEVDPGQAAKAVLTLRILDQLAGRLGLGSVTLRTDADAQQRLQALGTKGLMEGGEVLVDPDYLDPESAEGRRLLAHEAVHAAQDRLPAANAQGEGAGLRAEREAAVLSRQFAASGQMDQPVFGLPAGHLAADGDVLGKGLGPLISGYRGDVDSFQSGLGPQVGPKNNSGKKNSKEDRATKVERYADGVDGIADQIGDLDAFDDLCDTIEDGPQEYMKHMRRIERTSVFGRLAEMWQGAKDGGLDAAAMKKAFNYEFDGRGFWAETEKAFDLVQKRAKQEAKRRADADKAAKARDKALSSNADKADLATTGEGGSAGKLPLQQRKKIDPSLAKLMNATVTQAAPALPGLEDFTAMPEATLLAIEAENNHAAEFSQAHGPMSLENSRLGLVLEEYKGSVGNFAGGFVDGMVDNQTSKLGALGDKGLGKAIPAVKGLTTVMPAVSVVSGFQNLTSGEKWAGKGTKLSKAWGAQADKYAALDNSELSTTDRIGLWVSIIADWMDMAHVVISTASEILSFIQDLLYVLGAIFFAVGLALIWLPMGLPMVNAGIWMLETAQALQPAVKLLGMISYVLAGVVMGFRTAAVFMVPAEFLAAETEALGLSADSFASKSGSKVATKTNKLIKSKKEKKAAEQKAAEEEAANQIKQDGPKSTLSGSGTEQSLQDKMKQTTMDAQAKVDETIAKTKDKAPDKKKDEGNTQSGASVPVFDVNKDGVTNIMKNKNKMELGEVKTAKDGRIYTYATNKKGEKQLLWGTKGGDPSELQTKLDKYNTGTTFWQKQKKKVMNAQYTPDKLKNKQLFSLLKTAQTVTAWAVGGTQQQTLAEAVPTLGKLEGSMPDFFRKANLVVPLIDKNSGVAQIAAVRKDLVGVSSNLSTLFSELGAAAATGTFSDDELGVAIGVVQVWERGIRLLAKQIDAAASGGEIPRELPDNELKRKELKAEITALESELSGLESNEAPTPQVPAVASTTAVHQERVEPLQGETDDMSRIKELRGQLSDKRAELDSLGDPKGNKAPIQAKTSAVEPAKTLAGELRAVLPDFAPFKGIKVPPPAPPEDPGFLDKALASKSVGGVVEAGWDELTNVKTDEEVDKMVQRTIMVEAISDELPPPALFDEMMNHREAAALAVVRYNSAHTLAYMAFSAELAMLEEAQDTKAMADKAGPLRENIDAARGPLTEAKSQEQQRQAALSGMNTEAKGLDGWIANLIMEIITSMADNEDALDGKSSPGSSSAGSDTVDASKNAGDSAGQQKTQSLQASKAQDAFVDSATKVQQSQLSSVTNDINSLRSLHGEEMDVVTEFQLDKAEALAERDAAKNMFTLHSQAFVDQSTSMDAWSQRYRRRREDLEDAE